MKRSIIILTICLTATIASAQKIILRSGNLDFLKGQTEITTQFTYENMWVGKMSEVEYLNKKIAEKNAKAPGTGEEWAREWELDRVTKFEYKYIELWNKNAINVTPQITINDKGQYTMVVNTDFTEPGFNVGVVRQNAYVNLTIRFIENDTQTVKAVVEILKSPGRDSIGVDFDTSFRIQEAYARAGKAMARYIEKANK